MTQLAEEMRRMGRADLALSMSKIEDFVHGWWSGGALLPWFTDHGPAHSSRVADLALKLAEIPDLPATQRLNLLEKYILHCASWLHDVGMQSLLGKPAGTLNPADYERIRHEHPAESRRIIEDKGPIIGLIDDATLVGIVALVAQGHGTKYFLDTVEQLRAVTHVLGEPVRAPLLAAILLLGDEMDLDGRRYRPMPAGQPLNPLSQAHSIKHRRVMACDIKHGPQCRVGLEIRLEDSPQDPAQSQELELWIVEKLRMQLALVDSIFTSGFGGAAELDRHIVVAYQPSVGKGLEISPEIMGLIRDENRATQLIDHKVACERVNEIIDRHGVAVVTGRLNGWEDVDGREDILSAVLARARASRKTTIESHALYETAGVATLRDVLLELVRDAGLNVSSASASLDEIMSILRSSLRGDPRSFVIAISSADYLPHGQLDWFRSDLVEPLAGLENVAQVLTACPRSETTRWDDVDTVDSYGMDPKEVEWYLRRYTGARSAKVEAQQGLRYSRYKAFRQSYLAELTGL